jgi:hypothetical protein
LEKQRRGGRGNLVQESAERGEREEERESTGIGENISRVQTTTTTGGGGE